MNSLLFNARTEIEIASLTFWYHFRLFIYTRSLMGMIIREKSKKYQILLQNRLLDLRPKLLGFHISGTATQSCMPKK
jgi:hypothetical protein